MQGWTATWSLERLYELAINSQLSGSTSALEADDVVVVVVDFVCGVTDGEIHWFHAVRHRYAAVHLPQSANTLCVSIVFTTHGQQQVEVN